MRHLGFAALTLVTLACNRNAAPPEPLSQGAEKRAQEAAPPAVPSLAPKDLITDDKVGRYIVYQKEVNTVADLVMGAAMGAFNKSGGSQKGFEKELSKDERLKKIADTEASALAKSGLTRLEAQELAKVVSAYTPGATMGDAEMKKKAREDFGAKYGPTVLAAMEKHLPELARLQDEILSAAMGKKK
jgi:hypothetical protein